MSEAKKFDDKKVQFDLIDLGFEELRYPVQLPFVFEDGDKDYARIAAIEFASWYGNGNPKSLIPAWIYAGIARAETISTFEPDQQSQLNKYIPGYTNPREDASRLYIQQEYLTYLVPTIGPMVFGAKKYGKYNWKKGLPVSRCYAAGMRHVERHYVEGIDFDSELLHIDHLMANIMMAYWTATFIPSLDDRFKRDLPDENATINAASKEIS